MRRLRPLFVRVFAAVVASAAVAASASRPAPADPAQINRNIAFAGGASLLVQTIDFRAASIVLTVTIANPGGRDIDLDRARGFVLVDDAHAVHHLNPPANNPELRIPAHAQLAGDLVFIGPLAPTARQLTLSSSGAADNRGEETPILGANIPVAERSGSTDAYQADLPAGLAVRTGRITVAGPACAVSLLATNGDDRTVVLNQNRSLVLTDAHGVSVAVKPPSENRELVVPAGNRLDADLVFDCRAIDTGGPVTLSADGGQAGAADKPGDTPPAFRLAPAVEHKDRPAPPTASHATVAPIAWSHLSESAAPLTTVSPPTPVPADLPPTKGSAPPDREKLAAALHARNTERGLRIALPATTLFGATASTLDATADPRLRQLVALIAATQIREIVVTVYGGPAGTDGGRESLAKRRARAIGAWLEGHAPQPPPRLVAKAAAAPRPAAAKHDAGGSDNAPEPQPEPWVDVILRRDHLVPNSRSPASPSPGKM